MSDRLWTAILSLVGASGLLSIIVWEPEMSLQLIHAVAAFSGISSLLVLLGLIVVAGILLGTGLILLLTPQRK